MHLQDPSTRLPKFRPKPESAGLKVNELQPKNESASDSLLSVLNNIFEISSVIKNSQLLSLSKAGEEVGRPPTSITTSSGTDPRNATPAHRQASAGHAQRPIVTPLHPPVSDPAQPGIRPAATSQSLHAVQAHADESHVSTNQASAPGTQDRASASNTSRTELRAPAPAPYGDQPATLSPHIITKELPKPPSRRKYPLTLPSQPGTSASPARRPSATVFFSHVTQGIASESPGPGLAQGHDSRVDAAAPHSSVQKVELSSSKARVPPATSAPVTLAPPAVKSKCEKPWVTLYMAGRLGNQLCEYAHLMVLQIEHGAQVYLMPKMHIALHRPFPKISIKVKPKECNATKLKTFPWSKLDAKLKEEGSLNASAATIGYPCNVERFWKYRDTWRKEFAFSDTIRQKNRQRMKKVLEQWRSRQGNVTKEDGKEANPVVVGVHVRRTDYIKYLAMKTGGGTPPGLRYYSNAFEYYRKKFGLVAFVVSSDDRAWCRVHLERAHRDVVVSPMGTFEEDLGLLASTAHVVTSVGTFGLWAGLLAQGSLTYPSKVGKKVEYLLTTSLNHIHTPDIIPISPG
ncbi:uncharacterized protein LOC125047484 isoform X2 [Penaeus chinensis]|nr:uncharacterized protein LOC125047484 isoform X2 [Penaeus chinensis]XP_047501661.1 uncharacterized protein LOC125047484 isoform X2 [Penaeus chinensis]XP_047501662.1 uncharacterized protein LOC125047484 isoform X2 [Penaeus chinensis]